MGSIQAYDVCSICGHKAPTSQDHCHHIKFQLGEVLRDGRRVYMKNPKPKYFDISLVFKPADRIAYTLKKVAAAGNGVIGGHELAEIYGLRPLGDPKYAALRALASIVKEVPLQLRKAVTPSKLKTSTLGELRKQAQIHGIDHLVSFLSSNDWLLGPQDFADVIGHNNPEACGCAVDDNPVLDELLDDHTEVSALRAPSLTDYIPMSHSAREDLDQNTGMSGNNLTKRVIRLTIEPVAKTAANKLLDANEARGFASLYGHYKLAFAAKQLGRADVLRAVAATF